MTSMFCCRLNLSARSRGRPYPRLRNRKRNRRGSNSLHVIPLELTSPASRLPFTLEGCKAKPHGFLVPCAVNPFVALGTLVLPELEIGGLLDIALIVGRRRAALCCLRFFA